MLPGSFLVCIVFQQVCFGTSVASAGDVDADGVPDVLVASACDRDDPPGFAAYVFSGGTGDRLLSLGPDLRIVDFENRWVSGLDDVNRDGHADVALVAWRDLQGSRICFATVFSGADGATIWSARLDPDIPPRPDCSPPPAFICRIADVDGDQIADLCVGTWYPVHLPGSSRMEILSGRSGCMIAGIDEDHDPWRWEGPPAPLGDLDGDGADDVLVPVAVRAKRDWTGQFGIEARSGRTLRLIRRFEVPQCAETACDAAGDVDRDGVPDLLVAGYLYDRSADYPAFARIISGRDASILGEFMDEPCNFKRIGICSAGDVDRDGRRDIVFSAFGNDPRCPGIWVLSGWDLHPIRRMPMDSGPWGTLSPLGYAMADAGDIDQDGTSDFVVGTAYPWAGEDGYAEVYSGRTGDLLHRWTRGERVAIRHDAGR